MILVSLFLPKDHLISVLFCSQEIRAILCTKGVRLGGGRRGMLRKQTVVDDSEKKKPHSLCSEFGLQMEGGEESSLDE